MSGREKANVTEGFRGFTQALT